MSPAWAQTEDDDASTESATEGEATDGEATDGEATEGEATDGEAAEGSGQSYAATEQRFPIRRGLFAEGDFGIFLSFGGRNTNNQALPKRSTSNIQPYLGILVGYDLFSNDTMNFSAGLKTALMLNGGAGRTSGVEANGGDPNTKSNDFEIWEVGVGAAFDYLLTDRLGLSFKLDGGLALLNPSPFEVANTIGGDPDSATQFPNAGKVAIGGIVSVGGGVAYATLLTGFTVGVDVRFSALVGGGFIPALSASVPIKYNF